MTTFIDPATGYEVRVIRKPIRRIYLRVREGGSVEVTAPRRVSEREIRDFVAGKTAWLTKYMALAPEKIKFQYVTGEIHHVFGRAYPLQVCLGMREDAVVSTDGELRLVLRTKQREREKVFKAGMKRILLWEIEKQLEIWTKRMAIPESRITGVTIRVMKSRWGSCRRVTGASPSPSTLSQSRRNVSRLSSCTSSAISSQPVTAPISMHGWRHICRIIKKGTDCLRACRGN